MLSKKAEIIQRAAAKIAKFDRKAREEKAMATDGVEAERLVPRKIPFEDRIEPRHMEAADKNRYVGARLMAGSTVELAALLAQWTLVGRYEGEVATETKMKQDQEQMQERIGRVYYETGLHAGRDDANKQAEEQPFRGGPARLVDEQDEQDRQWGIEARRAQSVRLAAKIKHESQSVQQLLADAAAIHFWITGSNNPTA